MTAEDCTNIIDDRDCIQRDLPESEYCKPCQAFAREQEERAAAMAEDADAIRAHGGCA